MSARLSVSVMGLTLNGLREPDLIACVMDALEQGRGGWVITANLDQLRNHRARKDLRALFDHADFVVADGMPLVWASRLQGTALPERVAGSELVWSLSAEAALLGKSVYLLGDISSARELAQRQLHMFYPGLRIAGAYSPPLDFDGQPDELEQIRSQLLQARPDIVYVALGFPKQELLIARLRADLPHTWFMGVGIGLSFLGGSVKRAPTWMARSGLEWLHRLLQEPRRLGRRYLLHGLPFGARLLAHVLCNRLLGRVPAPGRQRTIHVPTDRRVVFPYGRIERERAALIADLLGRGSSR